MELPVVVCDFILKRADVGVASRVSAVAAPRLAWHYVVFLRAARGSRSSLLTSATAKKSAITAAAKAKKRLQVRFSYFDVIRNLSDSQFHPHVSHVTVY